MAESTSSTGPAPDNRVPTVIELPTTRPTQSGDPQDHIVYDVDDDGIATITFNRPGSLNSMTPMMMQRYITLLRTVEADPQVRVLILTGAGRGFCAGADLRVLDGLSAEDAARFIPDLGEGPDLARSLGVPVLAALNGPAVGVGLAIALAADIRYVAADAKLGIPFARLGLVAEYGSAWLLPKLIGHGAAAELLLTGDLFTGTEAHRMGLAQRVLPAPDVLPAVRALAHRVATRCAPRAMAHIKRMMNEGATETLGGAYSKSLPIMHNSLGSADLAEGVGARIHGRRPRFLPRVPAIE